MAAIRFRNIDKVFANGCEAIRDINLEVADGELLVLVGPSGCGKSTLLRMLAGLEEVSRGEIWIDGQVVNDQSPQQRNIAMVFQNYALYPHMTVRRNLQFPLQMMGLAKAEMAQRLRQTAELLHLEDLLDRRPRQLSGGQRQRVAMGRAIIREPKVFLMDEPLSNLDAKLRVQIRTEIAALQERLQTTTLYVTHDQVEAMTLGHRVAVLNNGRLQQVATAQELYSQPANIFVAGFIGNPGMNVFPTSVTVDENNGWSLGWGENRLPLAETVVKQYDLPNLAQTIRFAGLRPEAFSAPQSGKQTITAKVTAVEALGHEQLVYFEGDAKGVDSDRFGALGEVATRQTMVARLGQACSVGVGESVELGVDLSQLSFFAANGNALATKR